MYIEMDQKHVEFAEKILELIKPFIKEKDNKTDDIRKYRKDYYEAHKDKLKEKSKNRFYFCSICNKSILQCNKKKHLSAKLHMEACESSEQIQQD